ncbi:MAG: hypothetical protein AAB556_01820 [Patescibacteria group bacterium]
MNPVFFKNLKFWAVALAIILPLAVLYFDLRIYLNYATQRSLSDEEIDRAFLLNAPLIQKISAELESKKEFLRLPSYPLLKKPF